MTCSTQPNWKLNAPGRQGANSAKPKLSPTTPQPGFWGTAWEQGEPLCSPGILGALPAAAPLCRGLADTCREVALPHLDVPP